MTPPSILITGGTGSFGQAATHHLLATDTERIVIYSRDEQKQTQMRTAGLTDERIRYFIGDIRDQDRLRRAMKDIHIVIHAAALKQVPICEYNPHEAVKTNIDGTANVIEAALDRNVHKVLMVGTDKAVDPTNLYGATKLAAEKLMVHANSYSGHDGTRFACTRYGNVINSRGSVLPLLQAQHSACAPMTITDPAMTRFVLTLEQGVQFVLDSLERMTGGEVFVPDLPAVKITTIAAAVAWPHEPNMLIVGRRAGEKTHELLISANEAERVTDHDTYYTIGPNPVDPPDVAGEYSSRDTQRLTISEFRTLAGMGATLEQAAS